MNFGFSTFGNMISKKAQIAYGASMSPSQIDRWIIPKQNNKKFLQIASIFGFEVFFLENANKNEILESIENLQNHQSRKE